MPEFSEPVSISALSPKRLLELWMLQGGHPTTLIEVCVREDAKSKSHVQVMAIGEADCVVKWPATERKMVGWMRARIDEAVGASIPFARIESVDIDRTVDRAPVEEFLLWRLQEKIQKSRRRIAGLIARIRLDDEEAAVRYMRHGFDYTVDDPETFTWIRER